MSRRLLPALLVASALFSDLGGDHGLALAFLLFAIPAASYVALDYYGDVLESGCSLARPLLAGLAVVVLVSARPCGARPSWVASRTLPSPRSSWPSCSTRRLAVGALIPLGRTVPESA